MSTQTARQKTVTVPAIRARKGGEPIVVLTAYTAPMAKRLDPHVDILLVGDSLGMVLYGLDSTVAVTLEMMIAHGAAVGRGAARALVVVDMPFGSYQESKEQAFRNAARILKESGAAAVKLEGGEDLADTVAFLTSRAIPVMGHVGLMPQYVNETGGYAARGRTPEQRARILADAKAIADAGAFALVVEGVVEPLAREITAAVPIPTIGIGASAHCDGQVLVTEDAFGIFTDFTPKFVKRFAEIGAGMDEAVERYAAAVRSRSFPGPEHIYPLKTDDD